MLFCVLHGVVLCFLLKQSFCFSGVLCKTGEVGIESLLKEGNDSEICRFVSPSLFGCIERLSSSRSTAVNSFNGLMAVCVVLVEDFVRDGDDNKKW